jgi:hypothetical protein
MARPRVLYTITPVETDTGAVLKIEPPKWNPGQMQVERMAEGQEALTRKQCFRISDALFEHRPIHIFCKTLAQATALMAEITSKY